MANRRTIAHVTEKLVAKADAKALAARKAGPPRRAKVGAMAKDAVAQQGDEAPVDPGELAAEVRDAEAMQPGAEDRVTANVPADGQVSPGRRSSERWIATATAAFPRMKSSWRRARCGGWTATATAN